MTTENQRILIDYNEGRRSVQDVLHVCKSYEGPAEHFLWDETTRLGPFLFEYCLRSLSETKMFELLKALVDDNPDFPRIEHFLWGDFMDATVCVAGSAPPPAISRRVLLILAAPGNTRYLLKACSSSRIDPVFVNHLIDLDPDVLMIPDKAGKVPLHNVFFCNRRAPFVARMVELRPESLLIRNDQGRTPVEVALASEGSTSPELARLLQGFVQQFPGLISSTRRRFESTLMKACQNFDVYPNLIKAIVQAYPPALAYPFPHWRQGNVLPFELPHPWQWRNPSELGAAAATRALVGEETLELALAVVECALGFDNDDEPPPPPLPQEDGGAFEPGNPAWFAGHVRRTVAAFLPPTHGRGGGSSSFGVAQALRNLDNSSRRMDFCRALFRSDWGASNLPESVDDVVTSKVVTDLYRLNRRGRLNPSLAHQIALLESVKDNLDSVFLHLRVAVDVLMPPRVELGVESVVETVE